MNPKGHRGVLPLHVLENPKSSEAVHGPGRGLPGTVAIG